MNSMTENDVRERLALCDSSDVMQEIYSFGSMLLQECIDRLHKIDGKAGTLAGFSGAMLALIVSTFRSWSQGVGKGGMILMFLAAIAILLAGGFSVCVMGIRTFENWFSTNEWMNKDCLKDAQKLKKYHVLTMYGVIEEHEGASSHKTAWLSRAQWSMAIAGILLFFVLADAAWFSAGRDLLCPLFNSARIALR